MWTNVSPILVRTEPRVTTMLTAIDVIAHLGFLDKIVKKVRLYVRLSLRICNIKKAIQALFSFKSNIEIMHFFLLCLNVLPIKNQTKII